MKIVKAFDNYDNEIEDYYRIIGKFPKGLALYLRLIDGLNEDRANRYARKAFGQLEWKSRLEEAAEYLEKYDGKTDVDVINTMLPPLTVHLADSMLVLEVKVKENN